MPGGKSDFSTELTCALYAALGLTDSILQNWITLLFAVIVSAYVAGKHFDRPLYLLISSLYGLASIILLTRFASAVIQAFHYKNLLVTQGLSPFPVPNFMSVAIGGGTLMPIFVGIIGTLWFVRSTWKRIETQKV